MGRGTVDVIYGTAGGLRAERSEALDPILPDLKGSFGFSLQAVDKPSPTGGRHLDDLVASAPFTDLNQKRGETYIEQRDAGIVDVFLARPLGLARFPYLLSKDDRFIPGRVASGDRFGYSLAAGNFGRGAQSTLLLAFRVTGRE
jgi:hypothetical protein